MTEDGFNTSPEPAAPQQPVSTHEAAPAQAAMTVVAHVPNLFDRSRFQGQATFVETPDDARSQRPSLVMVDLDRCDDVAGFRIEGATVIGFGPHVDSALHQRAADAGYDEVLPRSVFFKRLPELLGSAG